MDLPVDLLDDLPVGFLVVIGLLLLVGFLVVIGLLLLVGSLVAVEFSVVAGLPVVVVGLPVNDPVDEQNARSDRAVLPQQSSVSEESARLDILHYHHAHADLSSGLQFPARPFGQHPTSFEAYQKSVHPGVLLFRNLPTWLAKFLKNLELVESSSRCLRTGRERFLCSLNSDNLLDGSPKFSSLWNPANSDS
jgi:hypothetical protein